jgi:hypothetical protein
MEILEIGGRKVQLVLVAASSTGRNSPGVG